jgi:hypothetical protein
MMRRLATFARLRPDQRRLVVHALWCLGVCRVRLSFQNLDRVRAWSRVSGAAGETPRLLAWAVETAARAFPGTTCLVRSFTLQRLLSLNGHPSELTIGVTKTGERLEGHAWLSYDGRILMNGAIEGKYSLLTSFPAAADMGTDRSGRVE